MIKLSVVIVDSRSKKHPEWVKECIDSVKRQTVEDLEVIVLDNTERMFSIGRMYNEGLEKATGDWVLYVNDDDYISDDYCASLIAFIEKTIKEEPEMVIATSGATFFDEVTNLRSVKMNSPIGAWKRDYFLVNKFDESLTRYIDVECSNRARDAGKKICVMPWHFGYYYRSHPGQISGKKLVSGNVREKITDCDICVVAKQTNFIKPYVMHWEEQGYRVRMTNTVPMEYDKDVKLIWAEWGDENAVEIAKQYTKAKKILRIHSYEAYSWFPKHMEWNKWDKIIFVADHTRRYLEKRIGMVLENAVVIRNGVDLDKFTIPDEKPISDDIAFVGMLKENKGVQLLTFLANELKNYKFHVKGLIFNRDIQQFLEEKAPNNLVPVKPGDDVAEFLQDKTFIINTSHRESCGLSILEGMACGCKPVIYDWVGAREIYGDEFVFNDIDSLKNILHGPIQPMEYRDFVKRNHDIKEKKTEIMNVIEEVLDEDISSPTF